MRAIGIAITLLLVLVQATAAFAHAALVKSEPADGAVLAEAPERLILTFSEPVSPLVMRLIRPDGQSVDPSVTAENATITVALPPLGRGTHILSWRVSSADGHPIGGTALFSVGAPTQAPQAGSTDTASSLAVAIWTARVLLYVGLFIGLGAVIFAAFLGRGQALPVGQRGWVNGAIAMSIVMAALSVGLQGLDATARPLQDLWRPQVWIAGLLGTYAITAVVAMVASTFGIAACRSIASRRRSQYAWLALLGTGTALAASGHATSAPPQWLTRPSVFAHALVVLLWIGAFLPLIWTIRGPGKDRATLARFSRAIPYGIVLLAVSGTGLAYVQLDRLDALWTTSYGRVLSAKLALVLALLALGAANRYWLVPQFERRPSPTTRRRLAGSIGIEFVLALGILGLVGLWRFTPPPRALAATGTVFIHIHSERAMTLMDVVPVRARGADVNFSVLDGESEPLPAEEVTLLFSNPAAGIEPIRRPAASEGGSQWRVSDLRLPVGGRWHLRVDILINDYEKTILEDDVDLPRLPP